MPLAATLLRFLVALLFATASIASQAAPAPKSISVVLDDNYPPYIFRGSDGQMHGILKDLWALWQQRTGIAVDFQPMEWDQARVMMESGGADVIDTIFETAQRRKIYDFSRPYAQIEVPIFFAKEIGGITDAASLKGFTVGVKDGDACVDFLKAHGINELKFYPNYETEVKAAIRHEIRLLCIDKPPAFYLFNRFGAADEFRYSPPLYTGEFHWAVAKGRTDLKQLVEQGFARISPDERSAIETRWLGQKMEHNSWSNVIRYGGAVLFVVVLAIVVLLAWNWSLRRRVRASVSEISKTLYDLKQSQQRFHDFFELGNTGMAITSPEKGWLNVNSRLCDMLGYRKEELYRMTWVEMTHPDDLETDLAQFKRLLFGEIEHYSMDKRFFNKNGDIFYSFLTVSCQRRPDRSVEYVLATLEDITERKQIEQALKDSEERYRKFFQASPDAINITRLSDGKYLDVNSGFEKMIEYGRDEVIGKTSLELNIWHEPADRQRLVDSLLQTGFCENLDAEFNTKDGRVINGLMSGVRIRIKDEDCIITITRDITERKRQERLIRENEQRLLDILNASPIGVRIATMQGRKVEFFNKAYAKMIRNPDAIGDDPKRYYVRSDEYEKVIDLLAQGKSIINRQIELRVPNGATIWTLASYMPIRYKDEDAVLAWFYNITESKRAEEELSRYRQHLEELVQTRTAELNTARIVAESASRTKSEFLSSMSHELRTPLNAILGYAQLFSMNPELSADIKEQARDIENAGRHLLALINDMIDLSRIEAGKMELSMEPVSVKAVTTDSMAMVASQADTHGIELIDVDCRDREELVVHTDNIRLRQVLINLLSNAIKYNRPHGSVRLACHAIDGKVRISVADTGLGIPADKQSRIFNSFDRLGRENGPIEGTGIGLVITKRIVEAMGGSIGFESTEGHGSTFWVELRISDVARRLID